MTLMATEKDGGRITLSDIKEFCVAGETEFKMSSYSDELFGKGTLFEQVEEAEINGKEKNV